MDMRYFEICFSDDVDGQETCDDEWVCIRGVRKPTVEEARIFCQAVEKILNKRVIGVYELKITEINSYYDCSNIDNWPMFE